MEQQNSVLEGNSEALTGTTALHGHRNARLTPVKWSQTLFPFEVAMFRNPLSQITAQLAALLFCLVPVCLSAQAKPAPSAGVEAGLDKAKLQLIKTRLQEQVDQGVIPGAVYLVARHGKIVAYDAVGLADVENNKPMRKDTLFQIMSMTKNFTGVAAMMLVEQGKLELRRPHQLLPARVQRHPGRRKTAQRQHVDTSAQDAAYRLGVDGSHLRTRVRSRREHCR